MDKECWLGIILSVGLKDNHLPQETELQCPVSCIQEGKKINPSLFSSAFYMIQEPSDIATHPFLCFSCLFVYTNNAGLIQAIYLFSFCECVLSDTSLLPVS